MLSPEQIQQYQRESNRRAGFDGGDGSRGLVHPPATMQVMHTLGPPTATPDLNDRRNNHDAKVIKGNK